MADEPPPPPPTLESMFVAFAKYCSEAIPNDGKTIILSQSDKWMQQAKIMNKKLTITDTGVSYNKFKKRALDFKTYIMFLEELAARKEIDLDELKEKLINCGMPGSTGTAPMKK